MPRSTREGCREGAGWTAGRAGARRLQQQAASAWSRRPAAASWMRCGFAFALPLLGLVFVLALLRASGAAGLTQAKGPAKRSSAQPGTPVVSPHGDLKAACEACHTAESWSTIRKSVDFDHASTGFPLLGRHAGLACQECHTTPVFSRVASSCADCHRDVHEGRNGARCQDCHTPDRWTVRSDAVREHARTGFPLRGVHALVECSRCHRGAGEANQAKLQTDCASCHADEYGAARNPNHAAAGYSTRCETCHDISKGSWTGSGFDHASTGFALTGAHAHLACTQCHANGQYTGMPTDCYACHRTNYAGTTNPNHQASGISTACATCHSTSAWQPSSFDHARTRFPLTGAHASRVCTQCHANGQYTGTPTDCYACHRTDYAGTTNPNHQASGFPTACATCHTTSAWRPASFNHATTRFPLTGAHASVACTQCHANGRYTGTPLDCYSCHQAAYAGTTNPNHQASGFSTACATCHTTNAWRPASFDHATSRFPLTGAHVSVACTQCHANGRYTGTPMDCYACHQAAYAGTTNPNHQASGFSTACATCHTTNAWRPASFDHATSRFPLTGAHVSVACTQCHANGQYTGTPLDCYACHQAAYAGTTNPNHAAASFGTDCASCHTTTSWQGATFDHDGRYFRIYSGRHRGAWTSCTICHQNSASYRDFTCLQCHQHNQTETDGHHTQVQGYRYESNACYSCHRNS